MAKATTKAAAAASVVEALQSGEALGVDEVEELRAEVAEMALQLQKSAKALAARAADVDRREAELERRRLDVARRHEDQLMELEARSRRLHAEMQQKLELEQSRVKERELTVQDTLQRMAAMQRDYETLQAAVLRSQSREISANDAEAKHTAQVKRLSDALDAANRRVQTLESANDELRTKTEKAQEAMRYYRAQYKAAVDKHNALAATVRRDEAIRLQEEKARLEADAKAADLAELLGQQRRRAEDGARPKAYAHDFVLHALNPSAMPSASESRRQHQQQPGQGQGQGNSETAAMRELALHLAQQLAQEDKLDRRERRRHAAERRERRREAEAAAAERRDRRAAAAAPLRGRGLSPQPGAGAPATGWVEETSIEAVLSDGADHGSFDVSESDDDAGSSRGHSDGSQQHGGAGARGGQEVDESAEFQDGTTADVSVSQTDEGSRPTTGGQAPMPSARSPDRRTVTAVSGPSGGRYPAHHGGSVFDVSGRTSGDAPRWSTTTTGVSGVSTTTSGPTPRASVDAGLGSQPLSNRGRPPPAEDIDVGDGAATTASVHASSGAATSSSSPRTRRPERHRDPGHAGASPVLQPQRGFDLAGIAATASDPSDFVVNTSGTLRTALSANGTAAGETARTTTADVDTSDIDDLGYVDVDESFGQPRHAGWHRPAREL